MEKFQSKDSLKGRFILRSLSDLIMKEFKLSIVVPCYNEESNIDPTFSKLDSTASRLTNDYEIIFVDNGAVKLNPSANADGELFFDGNIDLAVGGNLGVTATTGNITQGAAVAVTGASSFTASARNATIALDSPSNVFTGGVTYNVFVIPAQETFLRGSNITVGYASIGQTINITSGIVKRFSNIVLTSTGVALKTVFRTISTGGAIVVDLFSENFGFVKMRGANADLTSSVEKAGNIWVRNPQSPPPPHYLLWEDVVELGKR